MLKLGFVSAILANRSFEEVISFAADHNFSCVEVMCWPVGKAERRYAGVTHIDVTNLKQDTIDEIDQQVQDTGVSVSGLGFYGNPLTSQPKGVLT